MIRFFRNIRQNLLEKENIRKYSFYAIGEIVLVMIGILLALQVNTWNQGRIDKKLEENYLSLLRDELQGNVDFIQSFYLDRFDRKVGALEGNRQFYQGVDEIEDSTQFALQIGYGAVFSTQVIGTESFVFEEMITTGNLNVIEDESIRRSLIEYYGNMEAYRLNLTYYNSGYLTLINQLRPFNGAAPNDIDAFDIGESIDVAKTRQFYQLTNAELSYAYQARYFMNDLKESAQLLIQKIDVNLKEF